MLKEWLFAMLADRGFNRPDGRWLYAYRLESAEYGSLRKALREAVQATHISVLARRNQYFAALFVLYASEWWRREYAGGAWRWESILQSLGIRKEALQPNERTGLVQKGFAFWGFRPAGEGKRYFGSVVAHGGLPLKLIGHGGSRLNAIMGTVLRQAARYGWSDSQVVDAVADHAHAMPESLRHDEVFGLLGRMVVTTLFLKDRHKLGGSDDPLGQLDSVEPNWRDEYPLQIDDAAAAQLLTVLVKAASQAATFDEAGTVFQVDRLLSRTESGEWRLESRIAHPVVVPAEALAQQFGFAEVSELPRYFEIDATVGERSALTSGRLLLGSESATVSLSGQRRKWSGRLACEEHVLHVRASGRDLREDGVALPGGDALDDIDAPWVFVEEGEAFRLAGVGDVRLPDVAAIVAIAEDAQLEPLDSNDSPPEMFGRLVLDSSTSLVLWKVSGSVQVLGANDAWKLRIAQTRKLSGNLVLEGRRVGYQTRPWPVFRGKPNVIRYDGEGGRTILRAGFQWFAAGTRTVVDPARHTGPVELQVFEDDERVGRFRLVLISEHAKERFVSSASSQDAGVEFVGWGFAHLAVEPGDGVNSVVRDNGKADVIELRADGTPPKDIQVFMRWPTCQHELRVWMPFPASGGRAFDADGLPVPSGSVMSLRHAAGVRILIFDQHPNQPKKYEIELDLKGDGVLSRAAATRSRRSIPIVKGFAEVRLLDLFSEIEGLLGLSGELDAFVKLSLLVSGKPDFNISISRYDAALVPKVMGVALSDSDAQRFERAQVDGCEALALPILRPEEAPTRLMELRSEGVPRGQWSIEGLHPALAPWLIYPAPESSLDFRPLCLGGGCVTEDDVAIPGPLADCALAAAIRLPDTCHRRASIDAVLVAMAEDYRHDSWSMLDALWSAFGRLPLCSIDTFKVLANRPEVVVAMLLRSELLGPELGDHVRQMKRQLGMALELTGFSVWRQAIERFSTNWTERFGDDVARLTLPIVLEERLKAIAIEFPALRLNMEWLQFECLDECPSGLLQLQRDIQADAGIHLKRLWQGGDSLLQRALLRVHANDDAWPEPRFFTDRALSALKEALLADRERLLDRVALLEKFFWLENADFKLSVANVPVLCALWCVLDLPLDWWRDPTNRLALQRIRGFDPLWFEDAYLHAFAACIGLQLIKPISPLSDSVKVMRDGGSRVHSVSAGTVQRKRERIH